MVGWLRRLQDTEGGDSARFVVLQGMAHVKTVGRNQLDPRVERLAQAILYRRPAQSSPTSPSAPPLAAPQPSTRPAGPSLPARGSGTVTSRSVLGPSAPVASTQAARPTQSLPKVVLQFKSQGSAGQTSSAGTKAAIRQADPVATSSFPAVPPTAPTRDTTSAVYSSAGQPGFAAGHQGQSGSQGRSGSVEGSGQQPMAQYAGAQSASYSWQPHLQPPVPQVAPQPQAGLQYQAPVIPPASQLTSQQGFQMQAAASSHGYQLLQPSHFYAQQQPNVQLQLMQQLGYGGSALPYLHNGAEAGSHMAQQPAQWPYQAAHASAQPTGTSFSQPTAPAPVTAAGANPMGNPSQAPTHNPHGTSFAGYQHNGMGQPYQ